jgi:predicted DNA binding CopG/RHH family protein
LKRPKLKEVHTRLFERNVSQVKKIAASKGIPWQVELRLLVDRALKGEKQDFIVVKE